MCMLKNYLRLVPYSQSRISTTQMVNEIHFHQLEAEVENIYIYIYFFWGGGRLEDRCLLRAISGVYRVNRNL